MGKKSKRKIKIWQRPRSVKLSGFGALSGKGSLKSLFKKTIKSVARHGIKKGGKALKSLTNSAVRKGKRRVKRQTKAILSKLPSATAIATKLTKQFIDPRPGYH